MDIQPIYNRAGNLQRKMEVRLLYIAELNRMLRYYGWILKITRGLPTKSEDQDHLYESGADVSEGD